MRNPIVSRLHMRTTLIATASALVTCFAWRRPGAGAEQLHRVDHQRAAGSTTVLRIQLAKPPADAAPSFTVNNPPRVALDFADTDSKLGANLVALDHGDVHSVNVVQAGGRSRVVLNLKRPLQVQQQVEGNTARRLARPADRCRHAAPRRERRSTSPRATRR